MTDEELNQLLALAKETLGIVSSATAKDNSLKMIITAGVNDMTRAGVNVDVTNELVQNAIMTYVKANFGISNPLDKERFLQAYQLYLAELSLSEGYKEAESDAGLDL
jgi:hypothetical protein